MKIPFPLRLQQRRGLLVYQLVLILIGIIVLILVLLYIARRNQLGTDAGSNTTTMSAGAVHHSNLDLIEERFGARSAI